jgi:hypothetical protein
LTRGSGFRADAVRGRLRCACPSGPTARTLSTTEAGLTVAPSGSCRELAAGPALSQQVPALRSSSTLILVEANLIVISQLIVSVQALLLVNERFDLPENGFVRCALRHVSPPNSPHSTLASRARE